MKWKVRNVAPATPARPGRALVKGKLGIEGCRAKDEGSKRSVEDVHMSMVGGGQGGRALTSPMSHVSAAQQQAHPSVLMQASTCWDVRG